MTVVVIGGGAAGFFSAIAAANGNCRVIILEKTRQVLSKVKISGGGRCNVTHACFEPSHLIGNYPRGGKELLGPFTRFQPRDTMHWFEERGVKLKVESDGRVFPTTDSSDTIVQCLKNEAKELKVELWLEKGVIDCQRKDKGFELTLSDQEQLYCDKLIVAAGGAFKGGAWLEKLGHKVSESVPSLFTFNLDLDKAILSDLAGVSVPFVRVSMEGSNLFTEGSILITHLGLSGPAILKLSAFGARILHGIHYKPLLKVNWLPKETEERLKESLTRFKMAHPNKLVYGDSPNILPKSLWKALLQIAAIPKDLKWGILPKKEMQKIVQFLLCSQFQVLSKSTNKDEFVTCGGVLLREVNFKTMESRQTPHLFFAGEVLDIDGVTGGFNFQAAWTTGYIAGDSAGK